MFSKEVQKLSEELKKLREEIKYSSKKGKKALEGQLNERIFQYEEKRIAEIRKLTDRILTHDFSISLRTVDVYGKTGYTTDNMESMLLSKILMLELKRSYKCTPANRNDIIEELRALLDNPMPKIVIRADFREFFESISQDRLITKIVEDSYISSFGIKCLKTFFYKYNELSDNLGTKKGIPRGLSFSSYLAELYLASFDRKVLQMEGVYFYKRYVDDIIIIANPTKQDKEALWKQLVLEVNKIGLSLSDKKEKRTCDLFSPDNTEPAMLNYLGYQFRYDGGKLDVLLTEKKFNRYKKCIELSFTKYKEKGSFTSRRKSGKRNKADSTIQFMHRLSALTSNGHLWGRKNYVLVGIFYSNKYITSKEQLLLLDDYLKECLDSPELFSPSLAMFQYDKDNNYQKNISSIREKILTEYSFVSGFSDRRLYRWKDYMAILRQLGVLYNNSQNNNE